MINLLPPQFKKKLEKERKQRLMLIWLMIIIFSLGCFYLILISFKIYLFGKIEVERILVDAQKKQFEEFNLKDTEKEILSLNENIQKILSFQKNTPFIGECLEKISILLPKDCYLFSLSIIPSDKEKKCTVSLSGYIKERESLVEFKKRLEKEDSFSNIYFPPSNWVKPKDINFFVRFTYETN